MNDIPNYAYSDHQLKQTPSGKHAVMRQERHRHNGEWFPESIIVYRRIDSVISEFNGSYQPVRQLF